MAADGLDMLLATAAFDQKITAIFLGSGLFNLLPGQSHDINMKNQTKAFASLPLFDVANVLVDEREIQSEFERYGEVISVDVKRKPGYSFAFVEFSSPR